MNCPACGHDNLPGTDHCEECQHDLLDLDVYVARTPLHKALLETPLKAVKCEPPVAVTSDTPTTEVLAAMRDKSAHCALVTRSGAEGHGAASADVLVGIFTERDVLKKVAPLYLSAGRIGLESRAVSEFMTPDPVVLRGNDTLAVAMHKMSVGGFRHIPVVRDDGTLGLVAAPDLFAHLSALL